MKRCVFGAALLIAIGLGCLATGAAMERITEPPRTRLALAKEEALCGRWETAGHHALVAQRQWQARRNTLALAADHTPLEDIDDLFAQLSVCSAEKERKDFATLCAQLEHRLEAVSNAHRLTWWNFF